MEPFGPLRPEAAKIKKLLDNVHAFRAWLLEHPSSKAWAQGPRCCPIAGYLRHHNYNYISVGTNNIGFGKRFDGLDATRLEMSYLRPWVTQFIHCFDRKSKGAFIQRDAAVEALDQALYILSEERTNA